MKKTDIFAALIIGELVALLSFGILKNLGLETKFLYWFWPICLPVLSLFGLWVAYLLGKKFLTIWQVAKFLLVGALNTFVDLGILNILILISGVAGGLLYSVFKGASFVVAVINSYFWNKFWTFERVKLADPKKEFFQFLAVSAVGFLINVGAASLIVNLIGPQFGLSDKIWANIGAFSATFCGMTWNFLGYKFIVFK
ncbi:GtrA family protein [Patescibacteria group bacterium]|nr:GtrA family protein [Patescibacteria group bacterium]